ncbi:MAG TPA: NINE protein [Pyrinomonadaceae bacterium]|jgi:TM2 domain-containing membrane protein YozV
MDRVHISDEKKLTLLLLCWGFGLFGVHRFYTGKYLSGGLQLLGVLLIGVAALFHAKAIAPFFIIFPLWWVFDVLLIIMGKFTDKKGKPIIDWV